MPFFPILSEIRGFLSEEECRVVVQLAQLKGLMESQTAASSQGKEGSNQPLLFLSTEEIFSLLDLNQDGLLQKQEVKRSLLPWSWWRKTEICSNEKLDVTFC